MALLIVERASSFLIKDTLVLVGSMVFFFITLTFVGISEIFDIISDFFCQFNGIFHPLKFCHKDAKSGRGAGGSKERDWECGI